MKIRDIIIAAIVLLFTASSVCADWINPLELERGRTYILSRATPISPHKELPDSLEEIRKLKKVPRRGKIKIKKVVVTEDKTLYFVEAKTRKNRSVGRGWISSVSLTGQSLKKVAKKKRGSNKDAVRLLSNIWGKEKIKD
jgi:hypothetical protein